MPPISGRIPFSVNNPYRIRRPTTAKIIFLSCEGSVTEEEYFQMIQKEYRQVESKIQFISVAEDAVQTFYKCRTQEQIRFLSKCRPKQLLERINKFKEEKENIYEFSKYPEDEFWIVTDVDENTSERLIDEWNETLDECDRKGYKYAISNPFFEMWLLLHHNRCRRRG